MTARVDSLLEDIDHLVDDGELDAALAAATRLLAGRLSRADKIQALMARASIHDDLEDHERALADCDAALALAPRSPDVLYLRATIHQSTENWRASKSDLDAAIAIEPHADLHELRGLARYNLGDLRGARDDFAVAIAEKPDIESRFHTYRGMAALLLDEPKAAIEDFTNALAQNETDAKALAQRAKAYEVVGNPKAALADLDRLARLLPENPALTAERARVKKLASSRRG
ncbi:MAG: tetratricopeptide repeat protein [Myxococcota bacterium]|nr:tetratricopeptide repeat protein [Myxococcota bacterium]